MVNRLFSLIFSSTARTKSSFTTDGRPLRGSSCSFSRPSSPSSPISVPMNYSWHVLHTRHKVDDEFQPVSCSSHSRNGLQTAFHMSLYFLKHYKHTARCVNTVQMSANCVRGLTKNQKTQHTHAPSWPQRCSGNIRKRNLLSG